MLYNVPQTLDSRKKYYAGLETAELKSRVGRLKAKRLDIAKRSMFPSTMISENIELMEEEIASRNPGRFSTKVKFYIEFEAKVTPDELLAKEEAILSERIMMLKDMVPPFDDMRETHQVNLEALRAKRRIIRDEISLRKNRQLGDLRAKLATLQDRAEKTTSSIEMFRSSLREIDEALSATASEILELEK